MGGTSTDVSLVAGKILRTTENVIGGLPIRIPMIDIYTVGAGGGSIAWIDSGGVLKVGPESAGADPGPTCYGKGELPTVTDANLFLGRLDPDFFLGGEMEIFPERSKEAVKTLADKIGKTPVETAEGIIRIANTNMEKALRVISVERGVDPRGFSLFSFGGAGGLHAVELADRLEMKGVIIPRNAGVLSAYGLLLADSIKDYSGTFITDLSDAAYSDVMDLFNIMRDQGEKDLFSDGFSSREIEIHFYMDLRYTGQSYEITVPFTATNEKNWQKIIQRDFETEHNKLYSYIHTGKDIEIITLRAQAIGKTEKIDLPVYKKKGIKLSSTIMKELIFSSSKGKIKAFAYNRNKLEPGHKIKGPALIIDYESTSYLPVNYTAVIDDYCNIRIAGRKK
jgi:N-methylhydantoinase A/oxoprolinase/acetone carboxylase beta subunit